MQEGLLWFDADPKRNLAAKVTRAADRYRFKFGVRPDVCYVNSSQLDGLTGSEVEGVRLVPADNILKHHFWIGVDENGAEPELVKDEDEAEADDSLFDTCPRRECGAEQLVLSSVCWACGYEGAT